MDEEKADKVDTNCQKVFGDSMKSASADLAEDDAETIPFTVFCFRVGNCQPTDRQKVAEIFRSEGIDLLLLDSTKIRTEVVATVNLPGDYRDLSGRFVERLLETPVTREYWNCSGCEFKNNLARFKCLNCDLEKTQTRSDKAAQATKLTGSCDSEDRLKVALSTLKLNLLNFDFSIRLEPYSIRELRNLPCLPKVLNNGLYSVLVEYENEELYSLKRILQSIPHYRILQGENETKVQFEHHKDALQAYFHLKKYRLEFQSKKDLLCLCPIGTKLASLTEKDLCSLIFRKTQNFKNNIQSLPTNIRLLIGLCPDIIVSNDEEGVVLQFPSPGILNTILKNNGTVESNTVEKIKALAQRFQIIRWNGLYMIRCYHEISNEISSFLNENQAGRVLNNYSPAVIGFPVKLDLFRFLVRFSRTGSMIKYLCIQHVAPNNNTTQTNYTATYQSGDSQTTSKGHNLTSDNVVLAKGDLSVLTEKNLCSMIFKMYLNYRNKKEAFALTLRYIIHHCPDIIVSSTEESIELKFPSPEILTRILNVVCSQESSSLEKINTLPERFRLKATPLWKVNCKINIIDLSGFLQTCKAVILDNRQPVLIGFNEKKSAFQFLVKFWYLEPTIQYNSFIENLDPTQGNHPTRQALPATSLVLSEHVSTSTSSSITLNPDNEVFTVIQLDDATSSNASKDSSAPTDNPPPMEIAIGLKDLSLEDEEENKLVSIHNECIEERTGFLFHPNSICFLYPVEINMNHTSQPEIPLGILSTFGPVLRVTRTQNGFLRVWYSQRYDAIRTVKFLNDRYDIKQLRIEDVCGQELQEEAEDKEMMILFSSSTNQNISSEFCGSRIYKDSKGWVLLFEDPSLLFQAFYSLLRDKQYEDVDIQPLSFICRELRSYSDLFTLQIYPQSSTQIQVHEDAIVEGELYSFINKGNNMVED